LQGITGYYYALQEGLPVEIAIAVKEHYKPLTMADSIPSSDIGRIVSIADKIDSIVAFFSVNIIPSGSEDPFALRRQAQGIVQILLSVPYEINIRHLIDISSNTFNSQNKELIPTLGAFFMQRIEFALLSSGYPEDIVKGITRDALHAPLHILPRKAEAIRQFKQSEGYGKFLSAIKRVRNILPDAAHDSIDSHLLSHPSEKNLFKNLKMVSDALSEEKREHNYPGALSVLMTLTGAIHEFFDGVLVMDNDEKIKNNRIALLKKTWEAAQGICDFSQLSES
jgi:glycyl-tRNA synthetase beta chain